MDTEIRLVKVEKEVESLEALAEKNSQALTELRDSMERRFSEEHAWAERQFAELRDSMEQRFAKERAWAEQQFAELRDSMERRFSEEHTWAERQQAWAERQFAELRKENAELRKENNTNFRWMMGTFLTGFLFLLGLMGRIAGLY